MSASAIELSELSPGVFRVHYRSGADLTPALQQPLIAALEAAGRKGPTAVAFVIDPGIRTVEIAVPTFWLGQTSRAELRLAAMAIVTVSSAVRTAAKGFAIANTVRRLALEVGTFETEPEALTWVRAILAKTP